MKFSFKWREILDRFILNRANAEGRRIMHPSSIPSRGRGGEGEMEPNSDAYPSVVQAIRRVLQEDFDDERRFNRVEIRIVGGGTVVYRLHPRDGSEYVGGAVSITD